MCVLPPTDWKTASGREETFICQYHNNTPMDWVSPIHILRILWVPGAEMPRQISSICLSKQTFSKPMLLFPNYSFSPASLQGRFVWMFTGKMAAATFHCCSCAPGESRQWGAWMRWTQMQDMPRVAVCRLGRVCSGGNALSAMDVSCMCLFVLFLLFLGSRDSFLSKKDNKSCCNSQWNSQQRKSQH